MMALFALLPGSLLLLSPAAALPDAPPAPERLDRVQVQGEAPPLSLAPGEGAVGRVVGAAELLRMRDERLADALRRLPGVRMAPSRPGQPELPSLRGMGAGRTQLLVNGRRVAPGFSLDEIAPEQVARVEILHSAGASLSGEALAGSINIVLKPAARQAVRRLQAGLGLQSGQPSARAQLQRGGSLGAGWSGDLVLGAQQREAAPRFEDLAGTPTSLQRSEMQHHFRSRQLTLAPQLGWSGEGGLALGWQNRLEQVELRRRVDHALDTAWGEPPAYPRHEERYAHRRQAWRSELEGRWNPSPGWQLQGAAGVQGLLQRSDFSDQGSGLDDLTLGRLHERGAQASATLGWEPDDSHSLSAGLSWLTQRRTESRDQWLSGRAASLLTLQAGQRRLAWHLQDEWTLSPTQHLTLGWRQETLALDSEDRHQRLRFALPSLQWRWLTPLGSWRSGLSRSFRAPTLAQLQPRPFATTNNSALDPDQLGNPALAPERAWALDLQFQPRLGAGQRLSLGGFARRVEQPMVSLTRRQAGHLGAPRWVRMPVNAPLAWVGGLELELRWPLRQGLSLDLQATRSWSHLRGEDWRGLRLSEFRPLSAQLGLEGAWGEGGSWRLSYAWSPGGWTANAPGEREYSRGEQKLDLALQRPLRPGWALLLNLDGLLQRAPLQGHEAWLDGQHYRGESRGRAAPTLRVGLQGSL